MCAGGVGDCAGVLSPPSSPSAVRQMCDGDTQVELALHAQRRDKGRAKSRTVTPEESGGVAVISEHSRPQRSVSALHTVAQMDGGIYSHACLLAGVDQCTAC